MFFYFHLKEITTSPTMTSAASSTSFQNQTAVSITGVVKNGLLNGWPSNLKLNKYTFQY